MFGLGKHVFPNSSRVHLMRYNEDFARLVPAGSLVLDAGAGIQPYRHLFTHTTYESADFERLESPYGPTTYVCDLEQIPVDSDRYDFVVFNQVLEHLREPLKVLRELHRVLKPGGRIICTTPLFYEEHQTPYDFYRYTQFAHRYLFEQAGFRIDALEWMEGFFGTIAYALETACRYLPLQPRLIAPGLAGVLACPLVAYLKVVFAAAASLFYRLDIRAPYKGSGYPKNYVVLATKA